MEELNEQNPDRLYSVHQDIKPIVHKPPPVRKKDAAHNYLDGKHSNSESWKQIVQPIKKEQLIIKSQDEYMLVTSYRKKLRDSKVLLKASLFKKLAKITK